jgi:hypothetical protein
MQFSPQHMTTPVPPSAPQAQTFPSIMNHELATLQDDFVEVGVISRAHGIRGEVKVQLITDEPKKRLGTAGRR